MDADFDDAAPAFCPLCGASTSIPFPNSASGDESSRAGSGREAAALREALSIQHLQCQTLQRELEEERRAAASAASEAMSMIVRLQREKAEAQMDARQFRRFAESRIAHDAAEIGELRTRLLSLGYSPDSEIDEEETACPRLRLSSRHSSQDFEDARFEIPRAETPREKIGRLQRRLDMLESESSEEFPFSVDRSTDGNDFDSMSDRVYTVDIVHGGTPRLTDCVGVQEEEIQKLSSRLETLEADRESMKMTIASMGMEKSQVVLLKEIAQQLCKEGAPGSSPKVIELATERKEPLVKRGSFFRGFSILAAIKFCFQWIASKVFRRKKQPRIRYPIGLHGNNTGLLLLIDNQPRMKHRRVLMRPRK